jgi:hypothetical protein
MSSSQLTTAQAAKMARFDSLPDDAIVDDPVAAAMLSISVWTLRRSNPVPQHQLSERRRGRRVGDIRAKVRGTITTKQSAANEQRPSVA